MTEKAERKWDVLLTTLVKGKIIPRVINRVLLWGPPRTGKSSIAKTLFEAHEQVTLHRQMPTDDLLGGYVLDEGKTKWADGPAVRAMRNGTPIVLDEVDQYSGEIRCILHALLDDPPAITLASGERIPAAEGYCVIATTNALPSSLPAPIYDRFDLILRADTLASGLKETLGALAGPAENVMRKDLHAYSWSRPASVNLFLAAAKLRRLGSFSDEVIAQALGLTEKETADFLVALTTCGDK